MSYDKIKDAIKGLEYMVTNGFSEQYCNAVYELIVDRLDKDMGDYCKDDHDRLVDEMDCIDKLMEKRSE